MKNYFSYILYSFTLLLLLVLPRGGHAATLTFVQSPTPTTPGTLTTFEVRLNSEKDAVNVIEGSIKIPHTVRVNSVERAGSALTLWTIPPQFVVADGVVTFAGGVPGGIGPGQDIVLFTMTLVSPDAKPYTLQPQKVFAYRTDGQGTRVVVVTKTTTLSIKAGATLPPPLTTDTTSPQFVVATVGNDPSLFDGQSYLTLVARDTQSPISYFEVKEGYFGDYVRTGQYYVLRDQSLRSPLSVRVADTFGNVAVTTVPAMHTPYLWYEVLAGILGLVAVFVSVFHRKRHIQRHR